MKQIDAKYRPAAWGLLTLLAAAVMGLALWFILTAEEEPVSAAVLLQRACAQTTAQQSFDFTTTATGPYWAPGADTTVTQTWVYDVRVSGDDFAFTITVDGQLFGEIIGVGGLAYEREPGGTWRQFDTSILGLPYVHGLLNSRLNTEDNAGADPLCPTGDVTRVSGNGALGTGGASGHYRATQAGGTATGVAAKVSSQTQDFWVGADNIVTRTKQTITYDTGDTLTVDTTISGVGEANTITAPGTGDIGL